MDDSFRNKANEKCKKKVSLCVIESFTQTAQKRTFLFCSETYNGSALAFFKTIFIGILTAF